MGRTSGARGLVVFATYLLLSVILFGLRIVRHPAALHLGYLNDPSVMMWCMAWWPYALVHHLNPFITRAVWAPGGFNLTWSTSIPALALAFWPLTAAAGPVVAYNAAALAAPAVSGWSAFALCRRVAGNSGAAFIGGLLYGFSPYEVGHVLAGHLSYTVVFIPPLCALIVLKFVGGEIGRRRFTIGLTLLLAVQALISPEVLATMTIFGACTILIAFALMPERRRALALASGLAGLAYCLAALILTPFLYFMLAAGAHPRAPLFPAAFFSADLIGMLLPTPLMALWPRLPPSLAQVSGNIWENGWYLNPPILVIAGIYFWRNRGQAQARLLAAVLAIVIVAGLGPVLHIAGRPIFALPWKIVAALPLLQNVMPVRLSLYAFLALAVIAASWFSAPGRFRVLAFVLLVLFYLPNPFLARFAQSRYAEPAFFSRQLYRDYLRRGENVLVIPYGMNGPSMLWQAKAAMYFTMPGGYLGITPTEFRRWPIVTDLLAGLPVPNPAGQWKAFAAAHRIDAILVADGARGAAAELPRSLGLTPLRIGGVTLYRLPPEAAGQQPTVPLADLQKQAAGSWLAMLLCAGGQYLSRDAPLSELNPVSAHAMGLLPASKWGDALDLVLAGAAHGATNGLWLGPGRNAGIEIGMFATPAAARSLIGRYGAAARSIRYPYPYRYDRRATPAEVDFLLMNFPVAYVRAGAACLPPPVSSKPARE